jgi:glyoxylase-like metal-dependent hydrolase (beta-lactamase superfamily II)
MVVHHLNCGVMRPRWPFALPKLISHCLLIESRQGLILVDTGVGLDDIIDPLGRLGMIPASLLNIERDSTRTAIRQLTALGFDPRDVHHIVMTHLDFSVAGGLPDFPWAKVHVLDLEHHAALHPRGPIERNRYCQAHFSHGPEWEIHVTRGTNKWFGFPEIVPLPNFEPDLLMIPLMGHSQGHCGIAVRDEGGWLLHAGDAVFVATDLDPVEPGVPLGIEWMEHLVADDWDQAIANKNLLRQLAHEETGKVRIVCSHDPTLIDSIPPVPRSSGERAYAS